MSLDVGIRIITGKACRFCVSGKFMMYLRNSSASGHLRVILYCSNYHNLLQEIFGHQFLK